VSGYAVGNSDSGICKQIKIERDDLVSDSLFLLFFFFFILFFILFYFILFLHMVGTWKGAGKGGDHTISHHTVCFGDFA